MLHRRPQTEELQLLAKNISSYRYDAVLEFLELLAQRFYADVQADEARGRHALSFRLRQVANSLDMVAFDCEEVWKICEPHKDKE